MSGPRRVTLKESEFKSAAEVHAFLAEQLDFPDYYGCNLDALEDCLFEICTPTRIVLKRNADDPKPWFDGFEEVIRDCAQASCYLGCSIQHIHA